MTELVIGGLSIIAAIWVINLLLKKRRDRLDLKESKVNVWCREDNFYYNAGQVKRLIAGRSNNHAVGEFDSFLGFVKGFHYQKHPEHYLKDFLDRLSTYREHHVSILVASALQESNDRIVELALELEKTKEERTRLCVSEQLKDNFDDLNSEDLISLYTDIRRKLKGSKMWSVLGTRPNRDEYFSFIAFAASLRGSCLRRQVGAVLVSANDDILSTGYNGKGAGLVNCSASPCAGADGAKGSNIESCEAIHAEVNALIRCPDRTKIDTIYVTCSPCTSCVDILLGTPARRIVFTETYAGSEESRRRWLEAGREWVQLKPGEEQ